MGKTHKSFTFLVENSVEPQFTCSFNSIKPSVAKSQINVRLLLHIH